MSSTEGITPEEAPKAKRPRNLLAATTIHLTTPETLAKGLALVGADWKVTEEPAGSEIGLYTWVTGSDLVPALQSGAIYIGIAAGAGGLAKRTGDEESWRGNYHAHGVALERTNARVVTGPVDIVEADLTWVTELIDAGELAEDGLPNVHTWYEARTLSSVEEVAIRLAIHLGDTGAPVNSAHAGAWNNDRPGDWVAFAIAQKLTWDAERGA